MNAPTLVRVLADIADGAVTVLPDGRVTMPSDITDPNLYAHLVWELIGDGRAVHRPSGDVTLPIVGLAAVAR